MDRQFEIKNLFDKISIFCEEAEIPEIPMNIHYISGEVVKGECGEIWEKAELRYDFEEYPCGLEDYENFEDFWEQSTAMGGYFWRSVRYYFTILLDGVEMENERNQESTTQTYAARFDDIEEALEEATARAEKNAKFDWASGEWKQPKIEIECYFCG